MPSSSSNQPSGPAICPLQVETRLDVNTSCKEPEGSQKFSKVKQWCRTRSIPALLCSAFILQILSNEQSSCLLWDRWTDNYVTVHLSLGCTGRGIDMKYFWEVDKYCRVTWYTISFKQHFVIISCIILWTPIIWMLTLVVLLKIFFLQHSRGLHWVWATAGPNTNLAGSGRFYLCCGWDLISKFYTFIYLIR